MSWPIMLKMLKLNSSNEDLQDLLELTPQKDVLFITGDWNAKVGSQEIPGITGKFGLRVQNEAGQRLTEFWQENGLVKVQIPSSNNTRDDSTHEHHQMVNTEIRLIIFFAAKDGEALYSQKNKTRSWLWLRSWTPSCQIQTEIEESGENH